MNENLTHAHSEQSHFVFVPNLIITPEVAVVLRSGLNLKVSKGAFRQSIRAIRVLIMIALLLH